MKRLASFKFTDETMARLKEIERHHVKDSREKFGFVASKINRTSVVESLIDAEFENIQAAERKRFEKELLAEKASPATAEITTKRARKPAKKGKVKK